MPQYFPFNPNPRAPKIMPPSNACDCQFHVFGSHDRYPARPGASYEMPSATIAEALKMHKVLGIQRGVIVQPTTYGADHQALLDALTVAGPNYRGCAIGTVFKETTDSYIARLHDAGVRGARFNFLKSVNLLPEPEEFSRTIARIRELGWYMKIQPGADGILDSVTMFETLDIPVVIDHMGRPTLGSEIAKQTIAKVVELLKKGNFWVMLSNGYKLSKEGPPWDDVIPIARKYIEAAPNRVIWASDWPHPLSAKQPPNDGELLDLLCRFAPEESERNRILVNNPAALFGFES